MYKELKKAVTKRLLYSKEYGLGLTANIRIKEIREYFKISKTNMGKVLNLDYRSYFRLEIDGYVINIEKLTILAMFFNISLDFLTGISDNLKPLYSDREIGDGDTINGIKLKDISKL